MATKDSLGKWGEEYAALFLRSKGFEVVRKNWRSQACEIDLLLRRENLYVVCEVKTRRSHSHGHPDESVNRSRLERLTAAANIVASEFPTAVVRIDIVSITATNPAVTIEHRESVSV